jgi:hypothetical protein
MLIVGRIRLITRTGSIQHPALLFLVLGLGSQIIADGWLDRRAKFAIHGLCLTGRPRGSVNGGAQCRPSAVGNWPDGGEKSSSRDDTTVNCWRQPTGQPSFRKKKKAVGKKQRSAALQKKRDGLKLVVTAVSVAPAVLQAGSLLFFPRRVICHGTLAAGTVTDDRREIVEKKHDRLFLSVAKRPLLPWTATKKRLAEKKKTGL